MVVNTYTFYHNHICLLVEGCAIKGDEHVIGALLFHVHPYVKNDTKQMQSW